MANSKHARVQKDPKTYQSRVWEWVNECFDRPTAQSYRERNLRFIEEAIELLQSCDMAKKDILDMVEYTFSRPKGEVKQEVGGTMVTLAALCEAHGIDMLKAGEEELYQATLNTEKIQAKHKQKKLKDKSDTPDNTLKTEIQKATSIEVFTDGSCLKNPDGAGGWAAIIEAPSGATFELIGFESKSTNNKAEMKAVIQALEAIHLAENKNLSITIYSDSRYVIDGITNWIHGWKKRGWKTASGGDVKNKSLWILLDRLQTNLNIEWEWVKGHNGHPQNERADKLAREAASNG